MHSHLIEEKNLGKEVTMWIFLWWGGQHPYIRNDNMEAIFFGQEIEKELKRGIEEQVK